jgi:hypothetical protein
LHLKVIISIGRKAMEHKELMKKLAELEFANDQLLSEIAYLDELMKSIGFADGLATVKATARELLQQEAGLESDEPDAA